MTFYITLPEEYDPTFHGWIKTVEGKYAPNWFEGEMTPPALDDILLQDTQEEEEDDEVQESESENESSDEEDEEV